MALHADFGAGGAAAFGLPATGCRTVVTYALIRASGATDLFPGKLLGAVSESISSCKKLYPTEGVHL